MNGDIIKMRKYQTEGAKLFSGRPEGAAARKELNLNDLDNDDKNYSVVLPDDTISFNSSFFGGLFEESVIRLGREGFVKKYSFVLENGSDISDYLKGDIEEGINDALKEF